MIYVQRPDTQNLGWPNIFLKIQKENQGKKSPKNHISSLHLISRNIRKNDFFATKIIIRKMNTRFAKINKMSTAQNK